MFSTWSRQVPSFPQPVTPPTVDPDNSGSLVWIQVASEWLPFIAGALSQLRQDSTWRGTDNERFLAIQRATDMIAIISNATQNGCSMTFDIRLKPTDPCTIQKSSDSGVTWSDVFSLSDCANSVALPQIAAAIQNGTILGNGSDPRTQGTPQAPWQAGHIPAGQSAPCLSGANVSEYMKRYIDNTIAGLNAGQDALTIATGSLALVYFVFAAVDIIIAALTAFIGAMAGLGASVLTSTMTSTVYSQFQCIVNCHVGADGSCSQAQFDVIHSDVDSLIGGTAATIIDLFLAMMGPNGITKAGAIAGIASADCADCTCTWSHTFDFSQGQQGWQPDDFGGGPTAAWGGSGWNYSDNVEGHNYRRVIAVTRTVSPSTHINHYSYRYSLTLGTFQATDGSMYATNQNSSISKISDNTQVVQGTNLVFDANGSGDTTKLNLGIVSSVGYYNPNFSGEPVLISVTVTGNGSDPFI